MCATPEQLRGVITTRCYTNPHLPLPLPLHSDRTQCSAHHANPGRLYVETKQHRNHRHAGTTEQSVTNRKKTRWDLDGEIWQDEEFHV